MSFKPEPSKFPYSLRVCVSAQNNSTIPGAVKPDPYSISTVPRPPTWESWFDFEVQSPVDEAKIREILVEAQHQIHILLRKDGIT